MKDVGNLLVFILDQKSIFAHILKAIFAINKIHSLVGDYVGIKRTFM